MANTPAQKRQEPGFGFILSCKTFVQAALTVAEAGIHLPFTPFAFASPRR